MAICTAGSHRLYYSRGDAVNEQHKFVSSARVQKAKLAGTVTKKPMMIGLKLTILVLLAAGCYLVFSGIGLGYLLFSPMLVCVMLATWFSWDLKNLDSSAKKNRDKTRLDQMLAADIVYRFKFPASPQSIWQSIGGVWQQSFFVNRFLLDAKTIGGLLSTAPQDGEQIWQAAEYLRESYQEDYISAGMITAALLTTNQGVEHYLQSINLNAKDILAGLHWQENVVRRYLRPKPKSVFGGIGRDWAAGFTPVLDNFAHNISLEIQNGNLDFSSAARHNLLDQMEAHLARPDRNCVALVGETGVGKTELVYALADRLIRGETAGVLAYDQVVSLSVTSIAANLDRGVNLEQIMIRVMSDLAHAQNIILFLDEAQIFFSNEPGAVNIAQIILPIIQQGKVRVVMAMTPADWHKVGTVYPSLSQLFNLVNVTEPDEATTVSILGDMAIAYEMHSKKLITYRALIETYRLAARYLQQGKAFPAKAMNLLEDSLNYAAGSVVTEDSVARAVEAITNTKVAKADVAEKQQLLNLEEVIHGRMINQTRAVSVVANALRRSRAGVRDARRPVGSFLFLGPTGVGKTELAKSLAAIYFSSEANMIRLDMTEYQDKSDVPRLLAAANTGTGGSTFMRLVSQRPFSVILLDEIEKAHPDVLNLLLQMLDEGQLTDSNGKKVNFKEAIIICTSNAGADDIRKRIEAGQSLEQFEKEFEDNLINKNYFRPELINRFDEVVLFRPLSRDELKRIVDLLLVQFNKTMESQGIKVALDEAAKTFIVDSGYDPRLGARPMRRAMQNLVENVVAAKILRGDVGAGNTISLGVKDLENTSTANAPSQAEASPPNVLSDKPDQPAGSPAPSPGSIPPPKDSYR